MAGECIDLRSEFHSNGLKIIDDLMFFKMLGTIEAHMFAKMSEAVLRIILEDGTCIKDHVELGPVFRPIIFTYIIGQAIVEGTIDDFSVKWNSGPGFVFKFLRLYRHKC